MGKVAIGLLLLCLHLPVLTWGQVVITYTKEDPALMFGISRIESALGPEKTVKRIHGAAISGSHLSFVIDGNATGLRPEGYELVQEGRGVKVKAVDVTGAMYAALDIAASLRVGIPLDSISSARANPHFTVRAIKFNLPWSSYRTGPAMEQHMEICRDLNFWRAFLDQMAENRFNVLSLWNVHPFSFMVKPVNFPDANSFTRQQMKEWKYFWTELFRMCKERGVEPFIVNWNIAVSPEFAESYNVMERNDTSSIVKQYTREVVTQVINEYPDLAGIGITLADWMSNFRQAGSSLPEMTAKQREDWIFETVVAGIKQAVRPVKFLHRSVLSADPSEMRRVINDADLPDTTLVEIKFNWSHGHSTPKLVLTHDQHSGQVENHYWDPLPENYRVQWMVRNEDFFILRWGSPDFIRKHIRTNSKPYVNGYFVGSEGYIPALEYSHKPGGHLTWEYAFEKQWLFYELWGRLLYDPDTPDSAFASSFETRYPGSDGALLLKAHSLAGKVPLAIASFHAATWDYTLYSEGFLAPFPSNSGLHDTVSAFISIDELIHHPTLDPDYLSIEEYVVQVLDKKESDQHKISPLTIAQELARDGENILALLDSVRISSGALACEVDDLRTWANMALYFADKLRAGVSLQLYRMTGNPLHREQALMLAKRCLAHWQNLSAVTADHYREVPYIDDLGYGSGYQDARTFSWKKYLPQVMRDILIVEKSQPGAHR